MSIALACRTFAISEACYRYTPKLCDENALIEDWLIKLTPNRKRWGFGLCFLYPRNVKGFKRNHKRVHRIYCALELNLRIKPKKRVKREKPAPLAGPDCPNQTWSMEFGVIREAAHHPADDVNEQTGGALADSLSDGRSFRGCFVHSDIVQNTLPLAFGSNGHFEQ